jgi:pimeloyl-ACP methyl ester carboxylesterase
MHRAFFFQQEGARRFAVAHLPARTCGRPGVVVCHPYGEEKQFSDRVLVGFARRLARDGFGVLRFDCLGYGDSEGGLEDSTIEGQVVETLGAVRLAREELDTDRVVLLGLRLGATVAALAAERFVAEEADSSCLAGLVLWAPVSNGARYLKELIRKKLFGQLIAGGPRLSREQILAVLATEGRIEIEGSYLTRGVSEELSTIELADHAPGFDRPVFLSSIADRSGGTDALQTLAKAYERSGSTCEFELAEGKPYWDDHGMNEWYIPEDLYRCTLDWMRAQWPER